MKELILKVTLSVTGDLSNEEIVNQVSDAISDYTEDEMIVEEIMVEREL